MKHCIIAKFKPEVTTIQKEKMYPKILELFENTRSIEGVHNVELLKNCIDRSNRYDIMIRIDMEPEALSLYDACEWHHRWKEEYGGLLEKKAIFDYE